MFPFSSNSTPGIFLVPRSRGPTPLKNNKLPTRRAWGYKPTGSGAFDNIYNEDPIYTLSPGDVNAGSVTFTLTGTQSGCSNASDQLVLTIQKNPTANAGIAQQICQGDSVTIPGSATNASAKPSL